MTLELETGKVFSPQVRLDVAPLGNSSFVQISDDFTEINDAQGGAQDLLRAYHPKNVSNLSKHKEGNHQMKALFFTALFFLSMFVSNPLWGSEIVVFARCVKQGPEAGNNTSTKVYQFQINYRNSDINSSSNVELVNGMSMWVNDADAPQRGAFFRWEPQATVPLVKDNGSTSWKGIQTVSETASGYFYLDFRFALRITSQNGIVDWDNANLAQGFYNVQIQAYPGDFQHLRCNENTSFKIMPVTIGQ